MGDKNTMKEQTNQQEKEVKIFLVDAETVAEIPKSNLLMRELIFLGYADIPKSKKTGNPVRIVNFINLNTARDDARNFSFFVDDIPADVKALKFGLSIQVFFYIDDDLNRSIFGLGNVVKASPYYN